MFDFFKTNSSGGNNSGSPISSNILDKLGNAFTGMSEDDFLKLTGGNPSDEMLGKYIQSNANSVFGRMGGLEGLSSLASGVSSLGSVYSGLKQLGLAKDQLNMQRDAFNKNYTAQKNAFNEANEYRQRMRGSYGGKSQAEIDAAIKKYAL